MIKIITGTEAAVIKAALDDAKEILEEEGYEDEALELRDALAILKGLVSKTVEEVIE